MLRLFIGLFFFLSIQASLCAQYVDTIKVIDEEGFPVLNTDVYLVDLVDGAYLIDSASRKMTDYDGKVVFKDIGYDNYIHFSNTFYREQMLSIHAVRANELTVTMQTSFLAPVTVMGKTITQAKTPLSEVPNKVTVIDKKEIELYNPQNTADVLAQSGDVFVQKSQMGGGSPIIRGFEANKVLLVIDGVRMNNAIYRSGHLQNAITLDNNTLERVEVHHGPGSVMYGSDALGGVMHFYTKAPRFRSEDMKPLDANVYARFSSANLEATAHADINVGSKNVASFTSITYSAFQDLRAGRLKSSPNNMTLAWNRYFYASRNDSADIVRINDNPNVQVGTKYSQLDAIQKLRFKVNKDVEILFNLQYSTTSNVPRYDQLTEGTINIIGGKITDQTFQFSEWFYGPQQRLFASLSTKIKKDSFALFNHASIIVAFQKIDEDRISRKFGDPLRRIQQEDVYVLSLNADFIKNLGKKEKSKSKLLYGLEATHNIVQSTFETQNIATNEWSKRGIGTRYPDGGSTMTTAGVYASYRLKLGDRANIIGGIRYAFSYLSANFMDTLHKLPYSTITSTNHAVTGSVALAWDMGKQFQFNTAFSSSFRTPNIDDFGKIRAKGNTITIPNPEIRPEQAFNFEATLGKQFKKSVSLSATVFYTHLFDAILQEPFQLNGSDSMYYDGSFRNIFANVNAGEASIWGFSANLKVEFSENIFMRMGVNYTEGKELDTGSEPRPLSHIPPVYGQFDLGYKRNIFQTRFNVRFNGPKTLADYSNDSSENIEKALPDGTPAWFTVNIYASFKLHKHFSINLGVENLLDWHYRPYSSGVSAPGMNVIVTLRGHF